MSATPLVTWKDLCIDADEPVHVGAFWATALGLELHRRQVRSSVLADPDGNEFACPGGDRADRREANELTGQAR